MLEVHEELPWRLSLYQALNYVLYAHSLVLPSPNNAQCVISVAYWQLIQDSEKTT